MAKLFIVDVWDEARAVRLASFNVTLQPWDEKNPAEVAWKISEKVFEVVDESLVPRTKNLFDSA